MLEVATGSPTEVLGKKFGTNNVTEDGDRGIIVINLKESGLTKETVAEAIIDAARGPGGLHVNAAYPQYLAEAVDVHRGYFRDGATLERLEAMDLDHLRKFQAFQEKFGPGNVREQETGDGAILAVRLRQGRSAAGVIEALNEAAGNEIAVPYGSKKQWRGPNTGPEVAILIATVPIEALDKIAKIPEERFMAKTFRGHS